MTDTKQIDDGGPAFPRPIAGLVDGGVYYSADEGMSLRDWFAGQALIAIGAAAPYTEVAAAAYAYADAMLRHRSSEKKDG